MERLDCSLWLKFLRHDGASLRWKTKFSFWIPPKAANREQLSLGHVKSQLGWNSSMASLVSHPLVPFCTKEYSGLAWYLRTQRKGVETPLKCTSKGRPGIN